MRFDLARPRGLFIFRYVCIVTCIGFHLETDFYVWTSCEIVIAQKPSRYMIAACSWPAISAVRLFSFNAEDDEKLLRGNDTRGGATIGDIFNNNAVKNELQLDHSRRFQSLQR